MRTNPSSQSLPARALALALALCAGASQAAPIVNMDLTADQSWPNAPAVSIDPIPYDATAALQTDSNNNRDVRSNRNPAQTFQIPELIFTDANQFFQIDTIYIHLNNMGNNRDFDLRLLSLSDTRASTLDTSNVIGTWSFTTASTGNQIITFNFSGDPILLDRTNGLGSGYAWQILDDGGGTSMMQLRLQTGTDPYSGGNFYESGNRVFSGGVSQDLTFAIGGTVVIPEPGTLVLLGISLGSLLLFRRRKR